MSDSTIVDTGVLRDQVREKYRAVAVEPDAIYHFHTRRSLATGLGYDESIFDAPPDRAVESFAGVGNPFSLRPLDQTDEFRMVAAAWIDQWDRHRDELVELYGEADVETR